MAKFFTYQIKCWLLLIGAFLMHLTAQAQLELFSITQSTKSITSPAAPPRVSIQNNSAQVERNYNINLADTSIISVPSPVPRLMAELDRKQLQIDIKALLVKSLPANDPEKKEQQNQINELIKARDDLNATLAQQKQEANALKQDRDNLRRRLTATYEDQLNKTRAAAAKDKILEEQDLTSHRKELAKLRQYQDDYWKKVVDSELEDDELKESTTAYRVFDQQVVRLEQQLTEATAAFAAFEAEEKRLAAFKLDLSDSTSAGEKAYNHQLTAIQNTTTALVAKTDTLRNSLTAYNQRIKKWEDDFKVKREKNVNDDNIIAQPVLTSITGTGVVIPAVTLIGSHQGGDVNSPNMYSIRLFTALSSTDNTKNIPNERGSERLFIPEASTFGFTANATFAMKYADRKDPVMGITIGGAYLDKLMTPDTLTSFKTGVATLRGGAGMVSDS